MSKEMIKAAPGLFLASALALAAVGVQPSPAFAQTKAPGDQVARRNCSQCHAVGAAGDSPLKNAPPFREFHKVEDMNKLITELRFGLLTRHPAMPKLKLTPFEIDQLSAHIRRIQNGGVPAAPGPSKT